MHMVRSLESAGTRNDSLGPLPIPPNIPYQTVLSSHDDNTDWMKDNCENSSLYVFNETW